MDSRWSNLVVEVECLLNLLIINKCTEITPEEVLKVISVLKNNVPFDSEKENG